MYNYYNWFVDEFKDKLIKIISNRISVWKVKVHQSLLMLAMTGDKRSLASFFKDEIHNYKVLPRLLERITQHKQDILKICQNSLINTVELTLYILTKCKNEI